MSNKAFSRKHWCLSRNLLRVRSHSLTYLQTATPTKWRNGNFISILMFLNWQPWTFCWALALSRPSRPLRIAWGTPQLGDPQPSVVPARSAAAVVMRPLFWLRIRPPSFSGRYLVIYCQSSFYLAWTWRILVPSRLHRCRGWTRTCRPRSRFCYRYLCIAW